MKKIVLKAPSKSAGKTLNVGGKKVKQLEQQNKTKRVLPKRTKKNLDMELV